MRTDWHGVARVRGSDKGCRQHTREETERTRGRRRRALVALVRHGEVAMFSAHTAGWPDDPGHASDVDRHSRPRQGWSAVR